MNKRELLADLLLQSTIALLELELSETPDHQEDPKDTTRVIKESAIVNEIHNNTGIDRLIAAKVTSEVLDLLGNKPNGIYVDRQTGGDE